MELLINTYFFIVLIAILLILLISTVVIYTRLKKQKRLYNALETKYVSAHKIISKQEKQIQDQIVIFQKREESFIRTLRFIPDNVVILGEDNKIYKTFQYSAKNRRYLGRHGNKYINGQLCLLVNDNPVSLKLIEITDYSKFYLALNDKV